MDDVGLLASCERIVKEASKDNKDNKDNKANLQSFQNGLDRRLRSAEAMTKLLAVDLAGRAVALEWHPNCPKCRNVLTS